MHHGDISEDIAQGLKVLRERIEAAKIPSSKRQTGVMNHAPTRIEPRGDPFVVRPGNASIFAKAFRGELVGVEG